MAFCLASVYLSFALLCLPLCIVPAAATTYSPHICLSASPAIVVLIHYLHFRFHMKTSCNIYKHKYVHAAFMFVYVLNFLCRRRIAFFHIEILSTYTSRYTISDIMRTMYVHLYIVDSMIARRFFICAHI